VRPGGVDGWIRRRWWSGWWNPRGTRSTLHQSWSVARGSCWCGASMYHFHESIVQQLKLMHY
jgi:hypothetical protein